MALTVPHPLFPKITLWEVVSGGTESIVSCSFFLLQDVEHFFFLSNWHNACLWEEEEFFPRILLYPLWPQISGPPGSGSCGHSPSYWNMVQLVTQTLSLLKSCNVTFIHSVLYLVIKSFSLGALHALTPFSGLGNIIVHMGCLQAYGAERQLPHPEWQCPLCCGHREKGSRSQGKLPKRSHIWGNSVGKEGKVHSHRRVKPQPNSNRQLFSSGWREGGMYVGLGSDGCSVRKQRTPIWGARWFFSSTAL